MKTHHQKNISRLLAVLGLLVISCFLSQKSFGGSPSFDVFWNDFKTALGKGDKAKIASMVHYPLQPSLEKFSAKESQTFIAFYDKIFTPAVIKSLLQSKPQFLSDTDMYQVNYAVKDDRNYLMFGMKGASFQLVDIGSRE